MSGNPSNVDGIQYSERKGSSSEADVKASMTSPPPNPVPAPEAHRKAEYLFIPNSCQTFQSDFEIASKASLVWPAHDSAYACNVRQKKDTESMNAPSLLEYSLGVKKEDILKYEDGSYSVQNGSNTRKYQTSGEVGYEQLKRGEGCGVGDGFTPFSTSITQTCVTVIPHKPHHSVTINLDYDKDINTSSNTNNNNTLDLSSLDPSNVNFLTQLTELLQPVKVKGPAKATMNLTASTEGYKITLVNDNPNWNKLHAHGLRLGEENKVQRVPISVVAYAIEAMGGPVVKEHTQNVTMRVCLAACDANICQLYQDIPKLALFAKTIYARDLILCKDVDSGEAVFENVISQTPPSLGVDANTIQPCVTHEDGTHSIALPGGIVEIPDFIIPFTQQCPNVVNADELEIVGACLADGSTGQIGTVITDTLQNAETTKYNMLVHKIVKHDPTSTTNNPIPANAHPLPSIEPSKVVSLAHLPHLQATLVGKNNASTTPELFNRSCAPFHVPLLPKVPYQVPLQSSHTQGDDSNLGKLLNMCRLRTKLVGFSQGYNITGQLDKRNMNEFLTDLGLSTQDGDPNGQKGFLDSDLLSGLSVDAANQHFYIPPIKPDWSMDVLTTASDMQGTSDANSYNATNELETTLFVTNTMPPKGYNIGTTKPGKLQGKDIFSSLGKQRILREVANTAKKINFLNSKLPVHKRVYTRLERVAATVMSVFYLKEGILNRKKTPNNNFSTQILLNTPDVSKYFSNAQLSTAEGSFYRNDIQRFENNTLSSHALPASVGLVTQSSEALGLFTRTETDLLALPLSELEDLARAYIDELESTNYTVPGCDVSSHGYSNEDIDASQTSAHTFLQLLEELGKEANAYKLRSGKVKIALQLSKLRSNGVKFVQTKNILRDKDVVCHAHPMFAYTAPEPVLSDYGVTHDIKIQYPAKYHPIERATAVDTGSILSHYYNREEFDDRDYLPYKKRKFPVARVHQDRYYTNKQRVNTRSKHGLSENVDRFFGDGTEGSRAGMFQRSAHLHHWSRGLVSGISFFAKYNRLSSFQQYSEEEYNQILHNPKWTRTQTDTLFRLLKMYSMNFTVVHDRFVASFREAEFVDTNPDKPQIPSVNKGIYGNKETQQIETHLRNALNMFEGHAVINAPLIPTLPSLETKAHAPIAHSVQFELGKNIVSVLEKSGVDLHRYNPCYNDKGEELSRVMFPSPAVQRRTVIRPDTNTYASVMPGCVTSFQTKCQKRRQIVIPDRPVVVLSMSSTPVGPVELDCNYIKATRNVMNAPFKLQEQPQQYQDMNMKQEDSKDQVVSVHDILNASSNENSISNSKRKLVKEEYVQHSSDEEEAEEAEQVKARKRRVKVEHNTHSSELVQLSSNTTIRQNTSEDSMADEEVISDVSTTYTFLPQEKTNYMVYSTNHLSIDTSLPPNAPQEIAKTHPSVAVFGAATAMIAPTIYHLNRNDGLRVQNLQYTISEYNAHPETIQTQHYNTDQIGVGAVLRTSRDLEPASMKTIEDLKARFYFIQHRLAIERYGELHPQYCASYSHNYDDVYETKRKTQYRKVYTRSLQNVHSVTKAILEHRVLAKILRGVSKNLRQHKNALLAEQQQQQQQQHHNQQQQMHHAKHMLPPHMMQAPSMRSNPPPSNIAPMHHSMMQTQVSAPSTPAPPPVPTVALPAPLQAALVKCIKPAFALSKDRCPMSEMPPGCTSTQDMFRKPPQGAYLRTSMVGTDVVSSNRLAKKLESSLFDFNFRKPNPFTIASAQTIVQYDNLRTRIVTALQIERYIAKREQDLLDAKAALADTTYYDSAMILARQTVSRMGHLQ